MSRPTTRTVPAQPSARLRRGVRTLTAAVLAGGVATALSVGVGARTPAALADPGDTFVAIGTSQLVQSEDLSAILVPLDVETVTLHEDGDFSSCLGEGSSWRQVLRGSARPITATWTRAKHTDEQLDERIAQASSTARAKAWEHTLVTETIRACRTPRYDFHYGPVQKSRVGSAHATWALSYRGKASKPDGGVVVVRRGTNVGYLQVNGTWGDPGQDLESVAKVAADRLA